MSAFRVLLVDDEPLARERLRSFLSRESGLEITGECANGQEAVAALRQSPTDIVFLDVQMPDLNGFEVLNQVNGSRPGAVVFTTAYDEYAVKAFEVHAVDYVLKPFTRERLQTALNRAKERVQTRKSDDLQAKLAAMLEDLRAGASQPERLPIKSGGKVFFIALKDIDWIGSADNYVELHVGPKTHLIRETMNSMANRMPQDIFVRISRTCIINLSRVKELQPLFHGEYSVLLTTGDKLTLSRSYRDQLPRLGIQ